MPVHAGAIPDWHSSNPNCSAWAKANTTFLKCLSYTTPIWTVPTRQCVHMVTFRSSQGGSFYDVIYGMKTFGLVPEEEMRPGVMYGDTLSNHTELTAVSDAVVAAIAKGRHRSLQADKENNPLWKKAITAIHDIYLGERPEKFTYKGKEYTPKSFYESTGLNADDYISLTSYTHHLLPAVRPGNTRQLALGFFLQLAYRRVDGSV